MNLADLIHQLRHSKGWPTLGGEAARCIEAQQAEIERLRGGLDAAIATMIQASERNRNIRGFTDSVTRQILRDGIKAARTIASDKRV